MSTLDDAVTTISLRLHRLQPGPLAALRRMEPGGAGTPAFWQLVCELDLHPSRTDVWMQIIRIMAILSEKGDPGTRTNPLHDTTRPLGAVLVDGGDRDWSPSPNAKDIRPALSEMRLSRFLGLPPGARGEALERIARAVTRSRTPGHGVNCTDIAALLLSHDNPGAVRKLARDYYRRLDAASRSEKQPPGQARPATEDKGTA